MQILKYLCFSEMRSQNVLPGTMWIKLEPFSGGLGESLDEKSRRVVHSALMIGFRLRGGIVLPSLGQSPRYQGIPNLSRGEWAGTPP